MKVLVHQLIESQADTSPGATALVYKHETVTFGELWDIVSAAAGGLAELGLESTDRVGVYLEKRIETIVGIFGTAAADGVFIPINPILKPNQVAYILRDSDARFLITSKARLESLEGDLADCPNLRAVIVVDSDPGHESDSAIPVVPWASFLSPGAPSLPDRSIDTDMAAILYTSGSTGMPKGVVLSHRNLMAGAESVSYYIGNDASDRILALLPISFDAGLSQLTTAFNVGATVVLMNFLLARDVVRICEREKITGITAVPPLYIKLAAEDWPSEVGERIRYFANTGGHMPRPLLEQLRSIYPKADPVLMYGLTEAFRSTYLDPTQVDVRPDSMGKAIPNAEILVVRGDGSICDPNEVGELVHRGALVSMGYWNSPELSAERFKPAPGQDGTLPNPEIAVWSGDLVRRDEEGFLYFVGRNDEMIKTSGYRVSPTEIEEVVFRSGLVSEVIAVGLPDDELGHAIVVVASPLPGQDLDVEALNLECRTLLPRYMVPREIVSADSLPRNPNGKIDRKLIRNELIDRAERGTE